MEHSEPFQHILVATDLDGLAAHALVRGLTLGKQLDAEVGVVHAVEVPPPLWIGLSEQDVASMNAVALAEAEDAALRLVAAACADAGLSGEAPGELLRVVPGKAAKMILKVAERVGADLLVIGPHAKRSVFDLGSTVRALLAHSSIPVWTQPTAVTPIERILVPVDFSEHSRRAWTLARELAARMDVSLKLVHCFTPPAMIYAHMGGMPTGSPALIEKSRGAALAELDRWVAESGENVQVESTVIDSVAPERGVLNQTKPGDLIVLGSHGRAALSRFLVGSVAQRVLRDAPAPVLIVPADGREWELGGTNDEV